MYVQETLLKIHFLSPVTSALYSICKHGTRTTHGSTKTDTAFSIRLYDFSFKKCRRGCSGAHLPCEMWTGHIFQESQSRV